MACTIADCILMFSDIPTFGWSNPHSWLACSPHVVQLSPNQISGSKKWKKGNHCTKTTIDSAEWHSKPTMARSKPNDLHLWFRVGKHTTGIVGKKSGHVPKFQRMIIFPMKNCHFSAPPPAPGRTPRPRARWPHGGFPGGNGGNGGNAQGPKLTQKNPTWQVQSRINSHNYIAIINYITIIDACSLGTHRT